MKFSFNKNPIVFCKKMQQPSMDEIKNTFGLWNASFDDAIKFGGDITRSALQAMDIKHDRKNVIVDTKIHMLMPGWSPAILGWHNDGSPRDENKHPNGKGAPNLEVQENESRSNHYHIMVTGEGCLTKFLVDPIDLDLTNNSFSIYSEMSKQVNELVTSNKIRTQDVPSCTATQFDWWDIHTGVFASKHEWRYLIRVCESDFYEPQTDLRKVIRLQSQVYSSADFGW